MNLHKGTDAAVSWLPPVAWAAVLFALSSRSGPAFAPAFPHADKVQHAGAFGLLGFLVARAVAATWPSGGVAGLVLAGGLLSAAYGVADELHQSYTPGRSVEVADAAADAAGGFGGAIACAVLRRRARSVEAEPGHG